MTETAMMGGRGLPLLTQSVAARIVERVMANLERNVNVIGGDARILASGDRSRVGDYHPIAASILRDGETREITEEDARLYAQVRVGVAAPLHFDGERVGVIVVNGDPARVRDSVGIVAALAELLLYQELVIERIPDHDRAADAYITALLTEPVADDATARRRAEVLGLDLGVPRLVVLFEIQATARPQKEGRLPRLTAGATARQWRIRRVHAIRAATRWGEETPIAALEDTFLAALPRAVPRQAPDGPGSAPELAASLDSALEMLSERLECTVYAGIGRYHAGLSGLAASYHDAALALRIGRRVLPQRRAYRLDDLGAAAFVGPLDAATKAAMAARLLQPLEGHAEFMRTLEVFLGSGLSTAVAAPLLTVHRNTLNYRLERIHDLLGLDPRGFDDAVLLRLALLARDLYSE